MAELLRGVPEYLTAGCALRCPSSPRRASLVNGSCTMQGYHCQIFGRKHYVMLLRCWLIFFLGEKPIVRVCFPPYSTMASPRTRKVLKEVRAQDENNVSMNLWADECLDITFSCGCVPPWRGWSWHRGAATSSWCSLVWLGEWDFCHPTQVVLRMLGLLSECISHQRFFIFMPPPVLSEPTSFDQPEQPY